ncbi:hypothetical protein C4J81_11680 [Deltaproteobacteria bacterium Smac51]|nr:hypothetical protein C4J81_11680 [Deltaproteobacteria bacterium Smac51]
MSLIMNKAKNPGLILAVASPLAFTGFNIGVRFITEHMSIFGLLFLRGCIGVVVISLVARLFKRPLWGRNVKLLSIIGFTAFLSTACTTTAITLIPLYQAMVILYLFPTFAIILSAVINGEKIIPRDGLTVALALTGCLLLIWPDETAGLTFQAGHLIGILGSVLYSLGYVLARRLGDDNSGLEPIFHYSFYCALGAIPLSLLFGDSLGIDAPVEVLAGLALGAVGSIGQLMGYAAVRWLPAFTVGVIGSLEVLGGALASWLLFSDPMTIRAVIGGVIIVVVALCPRRAAEAERQAE